MTIQNPLRVALVSLVLVACGPGDETGLPHGVTAVAGGDTLRETDLEELLSRSPDLPDLDDARSIVSTWINLALLKSAMANDPDLSSYRERATETVVGELAVIQFAEAAGRDSRAATDAEIDSVIRMNAVRTFDSYSIPVESPSDTASIASAVETVESLRRSAATLDSPSQAYDQLPAGVRQRFDLVRLGAVSRGELPPALAEELWKLKVGDISPVMAGPGGVQFFVRRSSSDFRPLVADWLRPRIRAANDAVTVDSIMNALGLKASADGVARLRAGMHEPGTISGSGPLATWNGGELTPETALRRIGGLPPNDRAALAEGSDTVIAGVLDRFARGEILAAIATERLTDSEQAANRDLAQARWEEALDSLRASLGRAPGDTPTEWLGAIVRREMPARVFPGGLAGVLRDDNEVVVDRESARRATAAALKRWGTETN